VAEMKAWRRALRGEDLTVDAVDDEWGVAYVPSEAVAVKDPAEFGESDRRARNGRTESNAERSAAETVTAVARDSGVGDSDYAPFRSGAGSPAPKQVDSVATEPRPQVSPEQLITRMSGTLERINEAMTPDVLKAFKSLPEKKRSRFLKAVSGLSTKTARLI
jgi:hypothetical protein